MKYEVQWRYYATGIGGPWAKGEIVDLDPAQAATINLDSPGVLKPYTETQRQQEPAQDRMVRSSKRRGGK